MAFVKSAWPCRNIKLSSKGSLEVWSLLGAASGRETEPFGEIIAGQLFNSPYLSSFTGVWCHSKMIGSKITGFCCPMPGTSCDIRSTAASHYIYIYITLHEMTELDLSRVDDHN